MHMPQFITLYEWSEVWHGAWGMGGMGGARAGGGARGTANFVQSKANAQLAIIISHFAAVKNMIQFVLPAQRTTREEI